MWFGYRILECVFSILNSFTNFMGVKICYGDYVRFLAWQIFSNPTSFFLRLYQILTRKGVQLICVVLDLPVIILDGLLSYYV